MSGSRTKKATRCIRNLGYGHGLWDERPTGWMRKIVIDPPFGSKRRFTSELHLPEKRKSHLSRYMVQVLQHVQRYSPGSRIETRRKRGVPNKWIRTGFDCRSNAVRPEKVSDGVKMK